MPSHPRKRVLTPQTKAEELAWEQARRHGIDLVTILPEFILGPVLSPHARGTSVAALRGWLHGEATPGTFTLADVRAVARAHVRAAEVPRAGGRRFIVAAGRATTGRQISAILKVGRGGSARAEGERRRRPYTQDH